MTEATTMSADMANYLAGRIQEAHAARKIVTIGQIAKGHDAGRHIMALIRRHEMMQYVEMMRDPAHQSSFIESVCREIRAALAGGLGRLSPDARADLTGNLVLLMAAKLVSGDEHLLDGSGLSSLTIVVDHTSQAPWEQRGFLQAQDARVVGHG